MQGVTLRRMREEDGAFGVPARGRRAVRVARSAAQPWSTKRPEADAHKNARDPGDEVCADDKEDESWLPPAAEVDAAIGAIGSLVARFGGEERE